MMDYNNMYGFHTDMGYGIGWIFELIMLVLTVIAITGVILWLVKNHKFTGMHSASMSSIDILKSRYAKGEITKEQFDIMRKDIE